MHRRNVTRYVTAMKQPQTIEAHAFMSYATKTYRSAEKYQAGWTIVSTSSWCPVLLESSPNICDGDGEYEFTSSPQDMNNLNNTFKRNHEGTRPCCFSRKNPVAFAPLCHDNIALSNRGNFAKSWGHFGHSNGNVINSCTGNFGFSNSGDVGHSNRGICNHSSRGLCNYYSSKGNCNHSSQGISRKTFGQWTPVHQSVMSYGVQTDVNITASTSRTTRVRSFDSIPHRSLPRRFDPAEFHRRLSELRASIIARGKLRSDFSMENNCEGPIVDLTQKSNTERSEGATISHRSLVRRSGHRLKIGAAVPMKTSSKRVQKVPRPTEEASVKALGRKKRLSASRTNISRSHLYGTSNVRSSRVKPLTVDVRFISDIKYITKCIRDSICGPQTHVCPRLMEKYMNYQQNQDGVEASRTSSRPVSACRGCVPPSSEYVISAIVDAWLQELPVFPDFAKSDEIARDHAKAKLKRNLNKNLKDTSRWKDIIATSFDHLLIWLPPDPKNQDSFKENIIQDLLKRLKRISPENVERSGQINAEINIQPSIQSIGQTNDQTDTETNTLFNAEVNAPVIVQPSHKPIPVVSKQTSFVIKESTQALTNKTEELKGDTMEAIIKSWIGKLNFKNEATVDKEEVADYMSKLAKNIALTTEPRKLIDALNEAILIESNTLPLENMATDSDKREKAEELASALNDFLHNRRTSIIESVDIDLIKDIKKWCCNLNFSANADVDIDMYAHEIAADVKSVFGAAPWNLWDDLNNVILDHLFAMPLQYPESCTTESRKLVNALIKKLFIYKIEKWAERVPFASGDLDLSKFVNDLTKDVEYAMAANLSGDDATPVKETIINTLNKFPLTCDMKEKTALARELALDLCALPREKDNIAFLHNIVQEWIDALVSECRKPFDDDSKRTTTKQLVLLLNDILKKTPTEEMWDAMYFAVFSKLNELPLGLNDIEKEFKAEKFVNDLVKKIKYEEVSNWVSSLPFTNESLFDMDSITRRLCEQLQLKTYTDNENILYETAIKEMNKLPLQCSIKGKNELVENLIDILNQVPEEKDVIKYSVGRWLETITLNENTPECRIWVIDHIANNIKDILKIAKADDCWFKIKTIAIKAAKEYATESTPGMFYYLGESLANMVTYNLFEDAVKTWVNVVPFQLQAKDQISKYLLDKIRNLSAFTVPAQLKEAIRAAALTELNNLHVVCSESEKETFAVTLATKICSLPKERNVFLEAVQNWTKNLSFVTPPTEGFTNFVYTLSGKLMTISSGLQAEHCEEAFTLTILKELMSQTLKCTAEDMKELAEELGHQLTSYMFDATILNMVRGIPLRKSPPVDKDALAAQLASSLKRIFRDYGQANAKLPLLNEVNESFKKLPIDCDETKIGKIQQIMAETLVDEIIKFGELLYPGEKLIIKLLQSRPEYNSMTEKDIRSCVKRVSPKYLFLIEEGLPKPELEKLLKMKVDSCLSHLKEDTQKLHVKVSTWLDSLTDLNEDKSYIKPEHSTDITQNNQRISIKQEQNDDFTQNYQRKRIKPESKANFTQDFHMVEDTINLDEEISQDQLHADLNVVNDKNESPIDSNAFTNSASNRSIVKLINKFENGETNDQVKYDKNVFQTGRKLRGKWKFVDPTIKKSLTDEIFREEVDFQIQSEKAVIPNEKNYKPRKYNAKSWVISKILQALIEDETKQTSRDKFKERTVIEKIRNVNKQESNTLKFSSDIWCQKANDVKNEAHKIFIEKDVQDWIDTMPALNSSNIAEIRENNRLKDVVIEKIFNLKLKTLNRKQEVECEIENALELTLKRRNKCIDEHYKNEYITVLINNIIETFEMLQRLETSIQNDVINWVESIPELSSDDLDLENQLAVSKISRQLTKYLLSIIVTSQDTGSKKHFYNCIHEYLEHAFTIVREDLDSKTKQMLTNKLITYINVKKKKLEKNNMVRFLKKEINIFLQTTPELSGNENFDIVKFDEFCLTLANSLTNILFEEIEKGDLIPRILRTIRQAIEEFLNIHGLTLTLRKITILVNKLFKVLIGKICTTDILRTDSAIKIKTYIEKFGIEYEIDENKTDKAVKSFAKSIMKYLPELRIAMNESHLENFIKYLFNNSANILKEIFDTDLCDDSAIVKEALTAKIYNLLDEKLALLEMELPRITKRRLVEKLCSNLFGTDKEIIVRYEHHRRYLVQQAVEDVINKLNKSQQLKKSPKILKYVSDTKPDNISPHSTKSTVVEQVLTTIIKSTDTFGKQCKDIPQKFKTKVSEWSEDIFPLENDCKTKLNLHHKLSENISEYEKSDPENLNNKTLNDIKKLSHAQGKRPSLRNRTKLSKKLFDDVLDCFKYPKNLINEGDNEIQCFKDIPEVVTNSGYATNFKDEKKKRLRAFDERKQRIDKLLDEIISIISIQSKRGSNTSYSQDNSSSSVLRKIPTRFCKRTYLRPRSNPEFDIKTTKKAIRINKSKKELMRFLCEAVLEVNNLDKKIKHGLVENIAHVIEELSQSSVKDREYISNDKITFKPCQNILLLREQQPSTSKDKKCYNKITTAKEVTKQKQNTKTLQTIFKDNPKLRQVPKTSPGLIQVSRPIPAQIKKLIVKIIGENKEQLEIPKTHQKVKKEITKLLVLKAGLLEPEAFAFTEAILDQARFKILYTSKKKTRAQERMDILVMLQERGDLDAEEAEELVATLETIDSDVWNLGGLNWFSDARYWNDNNNIKKLLHFLDNGCKNINEVQSDEDTVENSEPQKKFNRLLAELAEKVDKLKRSRSKMSDSIEDSLQVIYSDQDEETIPKMRSELYRTIGGNEDPAKVLLNKTKEWTKELPSNTKPIVGEQKWKQLLEDLTQNENASHENLQEETKNNRDELNEVHSNLEDGTTGMGSKPSLVEYSEVTTKAVLNKVKEWTKTLPSYLKPIVNEQKKNEILEDLAQGVDKLQNAPGGETKTRQNIRNKLNEMYGELDEDDMARMESELYRTLIADSEEVIDKSEDPKSLLNKAKDWTKGLPTYIKPLHGEKRMNTLLGDLVHNADKLKNTSGGESKLRENIRNKLNEMYGDLDKDDIARMESQLYHTVVGDTEDPAKASLNKAKDWTKRLPSYIKPVVSEFKVNQVLEELAQKADLSRNTPGEEIKIRENIRNKLNEMYGELDEVDMARMESELYHTLTSKTSLNKVQELTKILPSHIKRVISEQKKNQLLQDLTQKANALKDSPQGEKKIKRNIRDKLNEIYGDLIEEDMARMESEFYHTLVGDAQNPVKTSIGKAKDWANDLPSHIKPIVSKQKMNKLLGDLAEKANELKNTSSGETEIRKSIRDKVNEIYGNLEEDDKERMESELYHIMVGDGKDPAKALFNSVNEWNKTLPTHIKPIVTEQKKGKLLENLAQKANALKNTPEGEREIRKHIRENLKDTYGDLDDDDMARMESDMFAILVEDRKNPTEESIQKVEELSKTLPSDIQPIVDEQKKHKLLEDLVQTADKLKNTNDGEREIRDNIRNNLKEIYGDLEDDDINRIESEIYHNLVGNSENHADTSLNQAKKWMKDLPSHIKPIVKEQKGSQLLEDLAHKADALKDTPGGETKIREHIRDNLVELYGDLDDDDMARMESELYHTLTEVNKDFKKVPLVKAKEWMKRLPSHIKPIASDHKINNILKDLSETANNLKDTPGGETKVRNIVRDKLNKMYGDLNEDDMARMESELYHTLVGNDKDLLKASLKQAKEWTKTLPFNIKPIVDEQKRDELFEDLVQNAEKLKNAPGGESKIRKNIRGKLTEMYGDLDESDMAKMESELYQTLFKDNEVALLNKVNKLSKNTPSYIKPIVGEQKREQLLKGLLTKVEKLNEISGAESEIRQNIRENLKEIYGEIAEDDMERMESNLLHTLFKDTEDSTTKVSLNKAKDWTKELPSHIKPIVSELKMNKLFEDLAQTANVLKLTSQGETNIRQNIRDKLNVMYGDLDEEDIAKMESELYQILVKDTKDSSDASLDNIKELIQTLPSNIKPIIAEQEINKLLEDLVQKADELDEKEMRKSIRNNLKEIYGDLDDDSIDKIESELYQTLKNKQTNDKLSNFVGEWTSKLPIQGDPEEVTNIKEDLASNINKTIKEINEDHKVFNDTALYKDTLKNKIDKLLSKLDISSDFKNYKLPSLKDDLIKIALEKREKISKNKSSKTANCPCFLQKDKSCQCFTNQTANKPCVNQKQGSCPTRNAYCMTQNFDSNECFTQTPKNSSCQTLRFRRRTVPSLLCRATYATSTDSLEDIPSDSRTTYCQVPECKRSRATQYLSSDVRKCNRNRYCRRNMMTDFTDDEENQNWCNHSYGFGRVQARNRQQEHFRNYRPAYCTQKPHSYSCNDRRMRY